MGMIKQQVKEHARIGDYKCVYDDDYMWITDIELPYDITMIGNKIYDARILEDIAYEDMMDSAFYSKTYDPSDSNRNERLTALHRVMLELRVKKYQEIVTNLTKKYNSLCDKLNIPHYKPEQFSVEDVLTLKHVCNKGDIDIIMLFICYAMKKKAVKFNDHYYRIQHNALYSTGLDDKLVTIGECQIEKLCLKNRWFIRTGVLETHETNCTRSKFKDYPIDVNLVVQNTLQKKINYHI
jgi:hypothetical protein